MENYMWGLMMPASFLLPLDEYMNDENVSEEWKKEVDQYVETLCSDYQEFRTARLPAPNIWTRRPSDLTCM